MLRVRIKGSVLKAFRDLTFSKQSVGGSMAKCHTNKLYGNLFAGQMWVGQGPLFEKKGKKKQLVQVLTEACLFLLHVHGDLVERSAVGKS